MSQILGVGEGKYLTFDRSWRDNGADPTYAIVGGQKVLMSPGSRARAEIYQRGVGFYYKDGSPVTDLEHVSWLPKKFREMAERFIKEQGQEADPLPALPTREAAVEQAVKRGRGRPKKVAPQAKLEIKDAESLKAFGGEDI